MTTRGASGLLLIAVCAIAGITVPRQAGAAILCQKKSGVIVVRLDTCKKKEAPFDLDSFIAQRYLHETIVVTESDSTDASNNDHEHTVACPAGYEAIGGGVAGEYNQISVDASGPTVGGQPTNTIPAGTSTAADGWFVRVYSFYGDPEPYKVSVICVKPRP